MKSNQVTRKLSVAFALLIAIIIGVGVAGVGQLSQMNAQIQDATAVRWPKIELVRRAVYYSDLNNQIFMEMFLVSDKTKIAGMLEQRSENSAKITSMLKQLESLVREDEEKTMLKRIEATRKPYLESCTRALDLLTRQDRPQEARNVSIGVSFPSFVAYHDAWNDFVTYQGRKMNEASGLVADIYVTARHRVIELAIMGVLLAGVIAANVTRRIAAETSERQLAENELRKTYERLEMRVRERTNELQRVQQQLVESSRLAGMAEVATGVLHNVGNVLNSVTVSANIIEEKLNQSSLTNLCKATEMLDRHREDLIEFLTTDVKGRQLPGYFSVATRILRDQNAAIIAEVSSLAMGIEHIKQIVQSQMGHARPSTVRSAVDPVTLIDEAIKVSMSSSDRDGVKIDRQAVDVGIAEIDKHKTLQILINLITNAKNAVKEAFGNHSPVVTVRLSMLQRDGRKSLLFEVVDNGVGIAPENLSRVFSHGFTTRAVGHGFGLHSAANAAQEMGGSLKVFSEGLGKGAKFTLEIPLQSREAKADQTRKSPTPKTGETLVNSPIGATDI